MRNNEVYKTDDTQKATNETLTFKLWLYFVLFAALIFILLWFMQVMFLQSYYSSMKKNEVIKLAEKIESEYKNGNFLEIVDNIAYKNMSNIYIYDLSGNLKYSSTNSATIFQTPSKVAILDLSKVLSRILKNEKISYTIKLDKFKSDIFIYGKIMDGTDACLIMATPIDPIDTTTSVLKNQLLYVTIISLVFSAIISIFISKNLSKPLRIMNDSAKKLAQGNYDVKFEKGGYVELDELADTLNFATFEMAKTDKIRKELIANVSHDLRTPLTMIKAYSEMIRDLSGDNKEKREEHLKVIIDEADRLTRIVNDMMDLSKIESGIIKLNKEKIDIAEVVNSIKNGFNILSDNKECIIKVTSPEQAFALADKTKIEQVVYNLVNNAINHSLDNKSIQIKITISSKKVRVEVIDNGPGIAKEELAHIWSRYYKVDKTFKRSNTGSGLGLSIVKNILEKHGANYGVESKVGVGSNFWFELERCK